MTNPPEKQVQIHVTTWKRENWLIFRSLVIVIVIIVSWIIISAISPSFKDSSSNFYNSVRNLISDNSLELLALGIGIFDDNGVIAAECGNFDMGFVGKSMPELIINSKLMDTGVLVFWSFFTKSESGRLTLVIF